MNSVAVDWFILRRAGFARATLDVPTLRWRKRMSRVSGIRIAVIVIIGAVLGAGIYYWPTFAEKKEEKAPELPHMKTGGTSVIAVIMANRWRGAFRKDKRVEMDYDSTGSTKGVTEMIDKHYAIGFTHAPLTEEQKKKAQSKGGEVIQIPVVICAVVPVYNLKKLNGKAPLKFTGEVLADIFLGKIETWNDPALKILNEGVELPDTKITVVHREDSSGTTFIFADYLQEASEAWKKEFPAPLSELKWKVGVGMERNQGVATHVAKTEGAIGYVDLLNIYFGDGLLDYGAVQNKDKSDFIHVRPDNMTAAAKALGPKIPDDLTFKLTNQAGKDAYPICGTVWAVFYQTQPASSLKHTMDFMYWVIHEGQTFASNMLYAPLSEEIVQRADQRLKTVKSGS
jgi:phosphate ABC transporter phosphate-binding protein